MNKEKNILIDFVILILVCVVCYFLWSKVIYSNIKHDTAKQLQEASKEYFKQKRVNKNE